ncbi:MAG: hypothetical protein JSR80_00215, partial [Verrucomicrobia bacterium]|nr:hypothetical protein [Verrucomicrobiota bacterium]
EAPRTVGSDQLLLVKTAPLHVRTVFGAVVNELLPKGFEHTSANILQPDTMHSGDIYELHGNASSREINDIPLEFYTLEPHREDVFFRVRDQLQADLEEPERVFAAFKTAPHEGQAAVFVVKGHQMRALEPSDWVQRDLTMYEFPGAAQLARQALMVERYIKKQAAYPFLTAMEDGLITSQGVLFSRYLPSPLLKRLLLSDACHRLIKGIYFEQPSASEGDFFSAEDRALLHDLAKFGIPIHWVDRNLNQISLYVPRHGRDCGMFVPPDKVSRFMRATFFGVYGSNLLHFDIENELKALLQGVEEMKQEMKHPLLNADTPLALVSGGGPGAMEMGNRVAKELGILSCANIIDFRPRAGGFINEQLQNPYVEAKMTYRLDYLVERQAEFHLDFPIFLAGGIGTDFEYSLEEVRKKTGTSPPYPILLFGPIEYWRKKVTNRFQCNLATGTIRGSEWVSNVFYCVQTAAQALKVYRAFFEGTLPIGPQFPLFEEGFGII